MAKKVLIFAFWAVVLMTVNFSAYTREEGAAILISGQGVEISVSDVTLALHAIPAAAKRMILADGEAIHDFVDSLYYAEVLAKRARDRGLHEQKEIRALLDKYERDLLSKKVLESEVGEMGSPNFEQAARERFVSHVDEYRREKKLKVSHIMLRYKNKGNEESLQLLKNLKARVENDDESFPKLASEYSQDKATAGSGGLLGIIDSSVKPSYFFEAAADLKKEGDIAGPIVGDYGYHLVRLEKVVGGEGVEFEDVKDLIVSELKKEYMSRMTESIYMDIRDDDKVQVNLRGIYSLVEEPPE